MNYRITGTHKTFKTLAEADRCRWANIKQATNEAKHYEMALKDEKAFKQELKWRIGYPSIYTKEDIRVQIAKDAEACRKRANFYIHAEVEEVEA